MQSNGCRTQCPPKFSTGKNIGNLQSIHQKSELLGNRAKGLKDTPLPHAYILTGMTKPIWTPPNEPGPPSPRSTFKGEEDPGGQGKRRKHPIRQGTESVGTPTTEPSQVARDGRQELKRCSPSSYQPLPQREDQHCLVKGHKGPPEPPCKKGTHAYGPKRGSTATSRISGFRVKRHTSRHVCPSPAPRRKLLHQGPQPARTTNILRGR